MQATVTPDNAAPAAGSNVPQVLVPFARAARERTEPFHDKSTSVGSSGRQVGPEDVLAHGYLRHLLLLVTIEGGDGDVTPAVAAADGPFAVFDRVELQDAAGGNPLVNLSGHELMMANKYGAYVGESDPRTSPAFAGFDADGNGQFVVRVPVEISARDALGALANQNAGQTYKLSYTVAPASKIFTTSPGTLPTVRVRAYLESWTQPQPTDLFGNPVAQLPPAHGTTQFWSRYTANIENGYQTVRLPRVGNYVRNLVAVFRTAAGARSTVGFPETVELTYDGNVVDNIALELLRHRTAERYGFAGPDDAADGLDTGVLVWDFAHDLDGKPGHEMRDGYLPTTQATDLSIRGTFRESGTLTVVTNDVAAAGGIYSA